MLEARNVSVTHQTRHGTVQAVQDVSLTCPPGTVTVLRGASGSGKSSLFSVLAGIAPVVAGEVRFMGRDLGSMSERERTALRRTDMALVFQAYNLMPTLSAFENVVYPLRRAGLADAEQRAAEALETLKVAHRADLRPGLLSGGEQQRVAVARALAMRPKALLADEPTGALDVENADHVMRILRLMADRDGAAVFVISHDPTVGSFADQVLELDKGRLHDARVH